MATNKQSFRYCFTWNNYTVEDTVLLDAFAADHCKYLVYGKEVGESGTPHLQGFFTLEKKKRITALKKLLGPKPHLEAARKSSRVCADYCKKGSQSHAEWQSHGTDGETYGTDALVTEHGEAPVPGQRTDLSAMAKAIKEGASMKEVAEMDPETYMRNHRGLTMYQALCTEDYHHDSVRGIWYYGPPGTGKSHKAREDNPNSYLKAQNKWFDGYAGEECIIIDDMDTDVLAHYLKIWADRYACSGEIKGGTVKLQHRKLIVTSNYSIEALFENKGEEMIKAIKRRFKEVKFETPYKFLEMEKEKKEVGDNRMTFNFSV